MDVFAGYPSDKSIAILNRSLASPGIYFSASVNNVEHVSGVRTRLQISLIKTYSNREQTSAISALYFSNFV